jgi:exodeoxyribonuclease VII large subunit
LLTPVTVSELSRRLKSVVESEFKFIFVTGEISNFKLHASSGHFYFTLKDESSQISAIMWSTRNNNLFYTPENGMKVIVKGRITLFESRGCYQIDVFEMKPYGIGELQIAFENLKNKLFGEGLFDESYKKPLPLFPEKIALITSESGAAIQDFLKVTRKRYPSVKLYLYSVNVQGKEASKLICKAIRNVNNSSLEFDAVVITRGGGSIEDLWCFNEESLAREIFNSKIPVVSAIGHEVDFTICDFVADLRAPTPSAAAEMIFPDSGELSEKTDRMENILKYSVTSKLENLKYDLDNMMRNYFFNKPKDLLDKYKTRIDEMSRKLESCTNEKITGLKNDLGNIEKLFKTLNPEEVLKRGFTIIKKKDKFITRKKYLKESDIINIKFYDGEAGAIVTDQLPLNLKNN